MASSRAVELFGGQQGAGFNFHQGRGRHQEVAGRVEVDVGNDPQIVAELVGDQADRQVEDIDLVLADEVQQQVEGAVEAVEVDVHGRPSNSELLTAETQRARRRQKN